MFKSTALVSLLVALIVCASEEAPCTEPPASSTTAAQRRLDALAPSAPAPPNRSASPASEADLRNTLVHHASQLSSPFSLMDPARGLLVWTKYENVGEGRPVIKSVRHLCQDASAGELKGVREQLARAIEQARSLGPMECTTTPPECVVPGMCGVPAVHFLFRPLVPGVAPVLEAIVTMDEANTLAASREATWREAIAQLAAVREKGCLRLWTWSHLLEVEGRSRLGEIRLGMTRAEVMRVAQRLKLTTEPSLKDNPKATMVTMGPFTMFGFDERGTVTEARANVDQFPRGLKIDGKQFSAAATAADLAKALACGPRQLALGATTTQCPNGIVIAEVGPVGRVQVGVHR